MDIPKEFFIEEESTLDEFTCPICMDIIVHPVTLRTCIHNFCMKCMDDWFMHQELDGHPLTCPLCRSKPKVEYVYNVILNVLETEPDEDAVPEERVTIIESDNVTEEFKTQLDNLKLKCVNAANGCAEILRYKDAKLHQVQCQFKQQQ